MSGEAKISDWLYVFVGKNGQKENFLGLYDDTTDTNFIPAFSSKEDAQDCYLSLPREKGVRYEVQAVHSSELHEEAEQNNFVVAMVDKDGKIIK